MLRGMFRGLQSNSKKPNIENQEVIKCGDEKIFTPKSYIAKIQ